MSRRARPGVGGAATGSRALSPGAAPSSLLSPSGRPRADAAIIAAAAKLPTPSTVWAYSSDSDEATAYPAALAAAAAAAAAVASASTSSSPIVARPHERSQPSPDGGGGGPGAAAAAAASSGLAASSPAYHQLQQRLVQQQARDRFRLAETRAVAKRSHALEEALQRYTTDARLARSAIELQASRQQVETERRAQRAQRKRAIARAIHGSDIAAEAHLALEAANAAVLAASAGGVRGSGGRFDLGESDDDLHDGSGAGGPFATGRRRFLLLLCLASLTLLAGLALTFASASLAELGFAAPRVHLAALALTVATVLAAALGFVGACLNHAELLTAFATANAVLAAVGTGVAAVALHLSETAIIDNVTRHFAPDHPAPEILDDCVQSVRLLACVVLGAVVAEAIVLIVMRRSRIASAHMHAHVLSGEAARQAADEDDDAAAAAAAADAVGANKGVSYDIRAGSNAAAHTLGASAGAAYSYAAHADRGLGDRAFSGDIERGAPDWDRNGPAGGAGIERGLPLRSASGASLTATSPAAASLLAPAVKAGGAGPEPSLVSTPLCARLGSPVLTAALSHSDLPPLPPPGPGFTAAGVGSGHGRLTSVPAPSPSPSSSGGRSGPGHGLLPSAVPGSPRAAPSAGTPLAGPRALPLSPVIEPLPPPPGAGQQ